MIRPLIFALLLVPLSGAEKRIAVFVGLCDNATQGIVKVGAKIGDVLVLQRSQRLRLMPHRRLQSGEGDMRLVASEHRSRQCEPSRLACCRRPLHRRPAGKAEAQQLRRLVEGFAQRIVNRCAKTLVAADAVHDEKLRMPARDQEQQIRRAQPL